MNGDDYDRITLSGITRVTVVSPDGIAFERYGLYPGGVDLHVQDDGRTLKIFPRRDNR